MAIPNNIYIDKYITDGKHEVISLANMYSSMLISSVNNLNHIYRIAIDDFFLKYHDELSNIIEYYSLPENMFYKPKTVSLELYGTTELWLSLLRANNMTDITQFHLPIIKVYNPGKLQELIDIFFKREGIMA